MLKKIFEHFYNFRSEHSDLIWWHIISVSSNNTSTYKLGAAVFVRSKTLKPIFCLVILWIYSGCGSGQKPQTILFPHEWLNWFLGTGQCARLTYGGHSLSKCFIYEGEGTAGKHQAKHLAHLWSLLLITQMSCTSTKMFLSCWQSKLACAQN